MKIGDYNIIQSLWQEIFGDDEDFIKSYCDEFAKDDNYYFEYNKAGEAVAMAHLPIFKSVSGLKVGYLYALGVKAAYRNKGIARALVNRIIDSADCSVIVTIPEPASLREWYAAQFGFCMVAEGNSVDIFRNVDFDLGTGTPENDVFMVRVTDAKEYLRACGKDVNQQVDVKMLYRACPMNL